MSLFLMVPLACLFHFSTVETGVPESCSIADTMRIFVSSSEHEAELNYPHSKKSTRTIFRQHVDASIGERITIGSIDADGLELDLTLHQIAPSAPCSKPHKVAGNTRQLLVYQLNNSCVADVISTLQDHNLLDDYESNLLLIPEHVTNSMIVVGLADEHEANFSSLIQQMDKGQPLLVADVTARTKDANKEIVPTRLKGSVVNAKCNMQFGVVQNYVALKFDVDKVSR